jgi:hypothetical protein
MDKKLPSMLVAWLFLGLAVCASVSGPVAGAYAQGLLNMLAVNEDADADAVFDLVLLSNCLTQARP